MNRTPVVKIDGCAVHENTYSEGDKVWVVTNLIARAKELEPFDLPLAAIYAGCEVWTPVGSAYGMAHHMRRALDVDTSYPIILCQEGFIMDGWHRVLRALIDGKATIRAVRFTATPPHDYLKPKP
ncbi:MAG: hypothetical protein K2X55_02365 [Burkholderiaceae bacterium]|nr:hypothetical protein [Burkholderiaceae bacterium]